MAPRTKKRKADVLTIITRDLLSLLSADDLNVVIKECLARRDVLQQQQRHGRLVTHYEYLRGLPAGTPLLLRRRVESSRGNTLAPGEILTLERPLRPPSTNILVLTSNGESWRLPMEALAGPDEIDDVRPV